MASYCDILLQNGAVAVPVLPDAVLELVNDSLLSEINKYPEYLGPLTENTPRVLGSFGAYGNPSSYHSDTVRGVRQILVEAAEQLFLPKFGGAVLEQLFDRVCVRGPHTNAYTESWHGDISPSQVKLPRPDGKAEKKPTPLPDCTVFGGWVNLNKPAGQNQFFSYVQASHIQPPAVQDQRTGFVPILKDQHRSLDKECTTLKVPPGYMVVFYQHVFHKIAPVSYTDSSLRLFAGWRLGGPPTPFFGQDYMNRVFEHHETAVLPSGQRAPLYSANHASIYLKETIKWSMSTIHRSLRVRKFPPVKSGRPAYIVAPRFLTRLPPKYKDASANHALFFRPYTQEERAALSPRIIASHV